VRRESFGLHFQQWDNTTKRSKHVNEFTIALLISIPHISKISSHLTSRLRDCRTSGSVFLSSNATGSCRLSTTSAVYSWTGIDIGCHCSVNINFNFGIRGFIHAGKCYGCGSCCAGIAKDLPPVMLVGSFYDEATAMQWCMQQRWMIPSAFNL